MRKNLKFLLILIAIATISTFAVLIITNQLDISGPGNVWLSKITEKEEGETFETQVYINSADQKVAAYGFVIEYDPNILNVEQVSVGADGFLAAVNIDNSNGWMKVAGYDAYGKPASDNFHILTITWEAQNEGESIVEITVQNLVDEKYNDITPKRGIDSKIVVTASTGNLQSSQGSTQGDVNNDGSVDIVDALLVAQYYVGLNPSNFDVSVADTNCDGSVNIIDALIIAQYYVGLISGFC